MADATTTVAAIKDAIRDFAAARKWEPFHTPKNIAMALASGPAIADELADVFNLLLLFSLHSGIDVSDAVAAKLVKNAVKYPPPAG